MIEIEWTEDSKDDYEKLEGSQRVFIDKAIARIKVHGMNAGESLSGNLTGCNRLKNKKMGLRIIFREIEGKVEVIQIVVIGKRRNKSVYKTAAKRIK